LQEEVWALRDKEITVVEFVRFFIPAMSVFKDSVICSVSNRSIGLMKRFCYKMRFFAEEGKCSKFSFSFSFF
jgi:hypothetical protein